ncbi:MAG TPA: hypothetical protein VGJ84_01645 [Polyangiaceae bacterium]|jgi:uncharacterized protein YlxW (UPF0749 family)
MRGLKSWLSITTLGALLVPGLTGCTKFKQLKECNQFIRVVNASKQELDAQPRAKNPDVATVVKETRDLSVRFEKLAAKVTALDVTAPKLKPHVDKYQAVAEQAAATLRDVASAVEKMDAKAAKEKQREFDQAAKTEDQLVEAINAVCHS